MAAPELPAVLTGRDAAADRVALARLVSFQRGTPLDDRVAAGREETLVPLERFRDRRLHLAADAKPWRRVADALVDSALVQPRVALVPEAEGERRAGPLMRDITVSLAAAALPEPDEIDLAVRWWELARREGLPVDADFGECWRAIEWLSLAQALEALGRGPVEPAAVARCIRVSLRYGQLKPLLPLLQPLTGVAPDAGYTF